MDKIITKSEFYSHLEKRLEKYAEIISLPYDSSSILHMAAMRSVILNEIKKTDSNLDLFGKGEWGYGVNYINDGISENMNFDVLEIEKINELNKHSKYNLLWVLIFNVESSNITYHTFCIDVCRGKVDFNSGKKIDTKQLKTVGLRKRDRYYFIDLEIGETEEFSFQIDSYFRGIDYASMYKRIFESLINPLEQLFNVDIVDNKKHELFKISHNEVSVLVDSLNKNAESILLSGSLFKISEVKLVKIFKIKDLDGLNIELEKSGRLHPSAKKFYGIGDWTYEKYLRFGEDVTTEFIEPKAIFSSQNIEKAYYSYHYNGESAESIYQLKLTKTTRGGKINPPTNNELFNHLFGLLFNNKNPLFKQSECLSYHYEKCELPKEDFLRFTKRMYLADFDSLIKKPSKLYKDIDEEIINWFDSKDEIISINQAIISHQHEQGENKHTEYKSTLRYCLKENKPMDHIEHSILKTLAAFLNSEGGMLLIGIDDNEKTLGLENDFNTFKGLNKQDDFLKHFDNLIENAFGNEFHYLLNIEFIQKDDKTICVVKVKGKSPNPVWLKYKDPGKTEKFYIRRSASTKELSPKEAVNYVREYWDKDSNKKPQVELSKQLILHSHQFAIKPTTQLIDTKIDVKMGEYIKGEIDLSNPFHIDTTKQFEWMEAFKTRYKYQGSWIGDIKYISTSGMKTYDDEGNKINYEYPDSVFKAWGAIYLQVNDIKYRIESLSIKNSIINIPPNHIAKPLLMEAPGRIYIHVNSHPYIDAVEGQIMVKIEKNP
jgi:hypothetical protein